MIPKNLLENTKEKTSISIAKGDGIGPEIMQAALNILSAANAPIFAEEIEIGEKVFESGIASGITDQAWESIHKNKIIFKAPITTPQGKGYKSLNVTFRKTLGLFANVRPSISYAPYVPTKHPGIDLVIVRENEEDTYAGIEYQPTDDTAVCIKLISREGCEKIVRYAFEYAKQQGRKKVTCMTKDNIMKISDGLFHQVFNEIAPEYPEIESEHYIIDIGTALIADQPQRFDVIVTLNLYGDIISDVASQVAGSVGLAGSCNIGKEYAMFEAIHGSAPDIAGKDIANPSAIIQASVMMLHHIGQSEIACRIQNALLRTIEEGIHTKDIYNKEISKKLVGTQEFAENVINNLGKNPEKLPIMSILSQEPISLKLKEIKHQERAKKELIGVDIYIEWRNDASNSVSTLGETLSQIKSKNLELSIISSRGLKVYPGDSSHIECGSLWQCRFLGINSSSNPSNTDIIELISILDSKGIEVVRTENLYNFNGKRGYSLTQGE